MAPPGRWAWGTAHNRRTERKEAALRGAPAELPVRAVCPAVGGVVRVNGAGPFVGTTEDRLGLSSWAGFKLSCSQAEAGQDHRCLWSSAVSPPCCPDHDALDLNQSGNQ